jgi:hypothetical protein
MDISSAKSLITIILMVVPGYLYARAKARFVISETPSSWQQSVLWYVVHSLTIVGMAFALFIISGADITSLLAKQNSAQVAASLITWQWAFVVFVLPLICGFVSGMLIRFNVVGWLFDRVSGHVKGVRHFLPLPELEAWDAAFLALNRSSKPMLVHVLMKSGEVLCGEFGPGACANRKGSYTDLFLSRAMSIADDGTLTPVQHSCGLYIRGSEVKSIYLFEADGQNKLDASVLPQSKREDSSHGQADPGSAV